MNKESEPPFDESEKTILDLIVKAHNEFLKLDPDNIYMLEWVKNIHSLQGIIIQRLLKRLYPKYFN